MLLCKTEVRVSPIHGLGLFALEAISAGRAVWRFTPGFDLDLDPRELNRLSPAERAWLLRYGYVDKQLQRFILCCDDARFINHSENPNVVGDYSQDRYGVDVAMRPISVGEEITMDYRLFEAA